MLQSTNQAVAPTNEPCGCEPPTTSTEFSGSTAVPEPGTEALDRLVQSRLSEKLGGVLESADPVAELDSVIESMADELDRRPGEDRTAEAAPLTSEEEIGNAIQTLVNVALEMEDPVSALEEGAASLAEALADRDAALRDWVQMAEERQVDDQAAYRHARFHRVSELMELGYGLDQAVAITNANEAEIRAMAVAAGRNPMEPIYEYAVLNGYQGTHFAQPAAPQRDHQLARAASIGNVGSRAIEDLAELSDEAFAEATRGDLWERIMRQ